MSHHQTRMRALDFIRDHTLTKGEAPSIREIAHGINQASPGSIHHMIGILEAEGRIRRTPGKRRGIEVVPVSALISIELEPALYLEVDALARKAGVTMQAVVIEVVRLGFLISEGGSLPTITQMIADLRAEVSAYTPIQRRRAGSMKGWRSRKKMAQARQRETSRGSNGQEPKLMEERRAEPLTPAVHGPR